MGRALPAHNRRELCRLALGVVGLGVLAGCGLAPRPSASAARPPRIGVISPPATESGTADKTAIGGLEYGLRNLGYVEGENLIIERRYGAGQPELLPRLARELVALPVDVIVAIGTSVPPAREATATIPIVMVNGIDPVGKGMAASLARPDGNVTGLIRLPLTDKLIELLKATVPTISHVDLLGPDRVADQVRATADALGVAVDAVPLQGPNDLEPAFERAVHPADRGLVVYGGPVTLGARARIAELALAAGLPLVGDRDVFARDGGLLAYGQNDVAALRDAATFVDKILRGTRPADLPIEKTTTFDCVVNLATARALGVTFPRSVLQQATEVLP